MKEKVNHAVIGGFVMGALVLAVAGILVFGSGKIMKKTHRHVLYFEGGLKGLNTGAAVAYRGVRIGSVVDITIRLDTGDMSSHIPVVIEVEEDRVEMMGGDLGDDPDASIQQLIDRGLRAKLVTESYLTGKLMIELGLYPGTPVRLLGLDKTYSEIPTIPSTIEELRNTLQSFPIEELFTKALAAMESIDQMASNPELPEAITAFRKTADDLRRVANNLDAEIPLLAADARETLGNYNTLALHLDKGLEGMAVELNGALTSAIDSFEQLDNTLTAMEKMVSEDSLLGNEIHKMLTEFTATARSIRGLAEYLERHPEALIQGKRDTGR